MEKEKNNFFFFLKKVTKVSVILNHRPINRRFVLHITSWQTLKNENTIQKKTSKVEFNYGNILAHIWNSTSCFQ